MRTILVTKGNKCIAYTLLKKKHYLYLVNKMKIIFQILYRVYLIGYIIHYFGVNFIIINLYYSNSFISIEKYLSNI